METKELSLSDIAYLPIDLLSHILPFVGFLSELNANGVDFDIYGTKSAISNGLDKLGKNHFEFEELDDNKDVGLIRLFRTTYQGFLNFIPAIEAIWQERQKKPKLIIADMFTADAVYLAKKHKIPLLVLYSSYFVQDLIGPWKEDIDPTLSVKRSESLVHLEKEVEEKYGVSIKCLRDIFIRGDHNISCLSKFIGDLTTLEKEDCSYLGPALRDESKSELLDVDPSFLKDNNLIYVSLGTAQPNIAGFSLYESIIEALKDSEHKVLISAMMGKAEELNAKVLPKNIVVRSWVPQMKILEHSKLFISHVGAGGLMEALSKGVPIIAVPNTADQPANARVVEMLNVGRWLKEKTPQDIKKLIADVLANENIKASCQKIMNLIDPQASKRQFVKTVRLLMK